MCVLGSDFLTLLSQLYVVARYVTHSKSKKPNPQASAQTKHNNSSPSPDETSSTAPLPEIKAIDTMNAIAAVQERTEEPDGATVHCIAVSELCFKHGRITVPPAIVLALSGFSAPSHDDAAPYSHTNPPPHWKKAREFVAPRASQEFVRFLRGGWKDVPEGERWWIDALSGDVEDRRKANVEGDGAMGALRSGMQGARSA